MNSRQGETVCMRKGMKTTRDQYFPVYSSTCTCFEICVFLVSGYFNYTYGQPGDSPVTKCFQIDYEPDISKEQIQVGCWYSFMQAEDSPFYLFNMSVQCAQFLCLNLVNFLQALVEKSSHCTQHLRYTCKNAPKTGKVTYSTCDGTLKKGQCVGFKKIQVNIFQYKKKRQCLQKILNDHICMQILISKPTLKYS